MRRVSQATRLEQARVISTGHGIGHDGRDGGRNRNCGGRCDVAGGTHANAVGGVYFVIPGGGVGQTAVDKRCGGLVRGQGGIGASRCGAPHDRVSHRPHRGRCRPGQADEASPARGCHHRRIGWTGAGVDWSCPCTVDAANRAHRVVINCAVDCSGIGKPQAGGVPVDHRPTRHRCVGVRIGRVAHHLVIK